MSNAENTKKTVVKGKHIPLDTYLRSLMSSRNLRPHHLPGMRAFAGKRKVATKEQWDALFQEY